MQCPNCGNQITDGAVFCEHCGSYCPPPTPAQPTTPTSTNPYPSAPNPYAVPSYQGYTPPETPTQPPKKSKKGLVIAIVVIVAVLIIGGIVAAIAISNNSYSSSNNSGYDSSYDSNMDIDGGDDTGYDYGYDDNYDSNNGSSLDEDEINNIVNSSSCSYPSVYIYNYDNDTMEYANYADDNRIASALVIFPTVYTIGKMIDNYELSLNDDCEFHFYNEGRTSEYLTRSCDGDYYTIDDLVRYSLEYSDNNAINTLMEFVGFDNINQTCHDAGYSSVKINKLVAQESNLDNYISASDLARMVSEMFASSGDVGTLISYMNENIQDEYGTLGMAGVGAPYKSFNGYTGKIYNEIDFVTKDGTTYIVAILSEEDSYKNGADLARSLGRYFN